MTDMLFYNVWRTETPENRARLTAAMREEAPKLAAKPGFLSITVLESQDGRVLVEGRWASRRGFEAFGTAEPGVFTEAFRIGPPEAPPADYPSPTYWDRFARREVVENGLKLSVVEGGQGEPVLLVPGMLGRPGRCGTA